MRLLHLQRRCCIDVAHQPQRSVRQGVVVAAEVDPGRLRSGVNLDREQALADHGEPHLMRLVDPLREVMRRRGHRVGDLPSVHLGRPRRAGDTVAGDRAARADALVRGHSPRQGGHEALGRLGVVGHHGARNTQATPGRLGESGRRGRRSPVGAGVVHPGSGQRVQHPTEPRLTLGISPPPHIIGKAVRCSGAKRATAVHGGDRIKVKVPVPTAPHPRPASRAGHAGGEPPLGG